MIITDRRKLWRPREGEPIIDDWQMGRRPPVGWIPVDISSEHLVVRWIRAAGAPLSHPFFAESILSLRSGNPPAYEYERVLDLIEVEQEWGAANPAGLVFHISRCGSTLVANSLRLVPGVLVLSEALPVDKVLGWIGSPASYWARLGTAVLPAITAVYGSYQPTGPRRVVVKAAPEGMAALPAIRARFPGVACLVVVRNPIEVLVSNVARPPRWLLDWYGDPRPRCLGTPPAAALAEGFTGFCAWVIGRCCSEAVGALDGSCWVLDYADISPDTVIGVARLFGLRPYPQLREELGGVFRSNAKRPDLPFESDVEKKSVSADAAMLRCVAMWADEPYRALLSHARRICGTVEANRGLDV